ncbi:cell surface glycoprotein CD200 receptor 1-like [Carlito syrichta]|uniref:Cell surface glycoprotein CD200 receptor 1-like n=1 Tax=Carlito syrichta TaxID=1868482 RepID=A0A1U7UAJ9_CARSF|nr:cell surface glycoprotein CD200 receptor 1-like [Carlito syrichta]
MPTAKAETDLEASWSMRINSQECVGSEVEGPTQPNNSSMQQTSKDNDTLASSISLTDGKQTALNNSSPPTEDALALVMRCVARLTTVKLPLLMVQSHSRLRSAGGRSNGGGQGSWGQQRQQVACRQASPLPGPVNSSCPVSINKKAVLSCPPIQPTTLIITWEINLRDKPSCKKSYKSETNESLDTNCTDERITWASRPDQNPDLQIDPVAINHDGYYKCEMATIHGNFQHGYHLQVLVSPEATLFLSENRSVVCKAVAGKPAAQISWTPEGDCVTQQEGWGNGTVTVESTCHWEGHSVSTVTCSVSHLTGNKSLSIELNPVTGTKISAKLYIYIILPIIILIIVGSICFLKISDCRKCKLQKTEPTAAAEEDEMQPYASYTERNNPLYDTTNKVKTSQVLQSEVDGTGFQIL